MLVLRFHDFVYFCIFRNLNCVVLNEHWMCGRAHAPRKPTRQRVSTALIKRRWIKFSRKRKRCEVKRKHFEAHQMDCSWQMKMKVHGECKSSCEKDCVKKTREIHWLTRSVGESYESCAWCSQTERMKRYMLRTFASMFAFIYKIGTYAIASMQTTLFLISHCGDIFMHRAQEFRQRLFEEIQRDRQKTLLVMIAMSSEFFTLFI